ncbi:MAG: DUF1992 domain-containing protein [Solirubrobacterales bacterium]
MSKSPDPPKQPEMPQKELSIEEQIIIKASKLRGTARYMASFEDLVEEKIRKAREQGVFDNLEGHGAPINLYENPFEPEELRMGHKILKDAGYAPYWVEVGKDVDAEIEKLWKDVEKFNRRQKVRFGGILGKRRTQARIAAVNKFLAQAENHLLTINRMVDEFNHNCPMWWLSRERLNVTAEMQKVREAVQTDNQEFQE